MTRKDYELIAEVIRSLSESYVNGPLLVVSKRALAEFFGSALAEDNPRFGRTKFVDAATGKQESMMEYADPYVNPTA